MMQKLPVMNHQVHLNDYVPVWVLALALAVLLLLIFPIVAATVAPSTRRLEFFLLTAFFLGPLGIGFAAVAQRREIKPPAGFRESFCVRCEARNIVAYESDYYICWRCDMDHRVPMKRTISGFLDSFTERYFMGGNR